ncbi:MAG: hypothetical protein ABIR96_12995 [Bdellovibrionota bacterium]
MKLLRSRRNSWLSSLVIAGLLVMPTTHVQAATASGGENRALQAFMLTTTYGVIAGSLTGLASLAFYKEPSTHSRNVALGASLGLYVGILLGAYVVYVPAMKSSPPRQEAPTNSDDPINLNSQYQGSPHATPWVNWDPQHGSQVGLVYNF